jgi:hypothetical protein
MLSLPPEYSGVAFQICEEAFRAVCTIMAISTLQKSPRVPNIGHSKKYSNRCDRAHLR